MPGHPARHSAYHVSHATVCHTEPGDPPGTTLVFAIDPTFLQRSRLLIGFSVGLFAGYRIHFQLFFLVFLGAFCSGGRRRKLADD